MAAHVGEFVAQDCLDLVGREPGKAAHRQQDHRTQPANHRRHLHLRRMQQLDGALDPEASPQVFKQL